LFTLLSWTLSGGAFAQDEPVDDPVSSGEVVPVDEASSDEAKPEEEARSDDPPQANPSDQRTKVELLLSNGVALHGTVLTTDLIAWRSGSSLAFDPDNGPPTVLAGAQIESVKTRLERPDEVTSSSVPEDSGYQSPAGFDIENIGKSRHLYAPSSIGLKKGDGYLSQKWVFSSAAYGVTDNVSLLAGTFTLFPPALMIVGGKVSGEIAPDVHLAAGGEVFVTGLGEFEFIAQAAFGGVTFGNEDNQITLSSGHVGLGNGDFSDEAIGDWAIPVIVSGQVRLSRRGVLVTENWLLIPPEYTGRPVILSAAYRLLAGIQTTRVDGRMVRTKPRFTWDFGVVAVGEFGDDSVLFPLPWIDFAYHFGADGK